MNREKRARLTKAKALLEEAKDITESVQSDEEFSLDNMPENLAGSLRYETMEEAVEGLESAAERMEEAIEAIDEVIFM